MSDYVLADHLNTKLSLTDDDISKFEQQGILHPLRKNNRVYYSSADYYRLKALLHFMRDEGLSLDTARERIAAPKRAKDVPGSLGAELAQR